MSATNSVRSEIHQARAGVDSQPTGLRRREIVFLLSLITLSIGLRLIHITQLFVDAWSWKQLTNAMISRNFYLHGFHFFYPQIDWAGPYPGYIGTELPLVPFLASLLYLVFGVHEWVGRSISVFFFAVSMPFFYLFVRKISNERSAMVATAVYSLAPLTFFASRSFISDMASLSFAIMAMYLFSEWLDDPASRKLFFWAALTTTLAILVKLPQIIVGVPFLYLCWDKYGVGLFRRRELWIFAAVVLVLPLAWEAHAYRISVTQYPYHFAGEHGIGIVSWWFYIFILYQTVLGLTPVLFVVLLIGVLVRPRGKYGLVFHWWLLALLVFVILAGYGNRHPHYRLAAVPVAAAFTAFLFDAVLSRSRRLAYSRIAQAGAYLLFFSSLGYLSYLSLKRSYSPWQNPAVNAAIELEKISPPEALILVADGGTPTVFYYGKRKGWHFLPLWGDDPAESEQAIQELENLRAKGAAYLVFTKDTLWWLDHYKGFRQHLDSRYRRVRESVDYIIYDISLAQAKQ